MTIFTGTSGVDTANASGPSVSGFTTGTGPDLTDASDDTFDCQGGADVIDAGTTNDTLIGGGGADDLNGGGGSDIYQFNSGDFVSTESVNDLGIGGTDTIELIGNATVIDFRVGTVLNIEALLFNDLQTAEFDQTQLPTNLSVTGEGTTSQAVIVHMSTGTFTAGGWSFIDWGANDKVNIVGRVSGDSITGSSQADFISGLGGADSINGGESGDTYQYISSLEAAGSINDSGTNGIDRLSLFADQNFTGMSIAGIEGVLFNGANTATFNASQFGAGLISTDFQVTGVAGTVQNIVVNNAESFSLTSWILSSWEFFNGAELDVISLNGTNGANTLTGSGGREIIFGGNGADILRGGAGGDSLDGGDGSDIYEYGSSEVVAGEQINDTGTVGKDVVRFLDDVSFSALQVGDFSGIEAFLFTGEQEFRINSFPIFGQNFEIAGSNGTAQSFIVDNANEFDISGWTFKNWETSDTLTLNGTSVAGTMIGSSQRDSINSQQGEDILIGGRGKDTLTGGTEADIFDFNSPKDSVKGANRDVITDFSGVNALAPEFDLIDLSTIDARTTRAGDQKFKFIGGQKFHDRAGELHVLNKGAFFLVEGDRNGDGRADFQIEVNHDAALARDDFVL